VKSKDLARINQNIFSWGLNAATRKRAKELSITLTYKKCGHKMLITLKKNNEYG